MKSNRVVIAMSGGVDSSLAAALLQKKGYDVIGLSLKFWGEENRCCSEQDLYDAREVAHQLSIPHHTISMKEIYRYPRLYRRGNL